MQQLTPTQLKQWSDSGRDFVLVDVREVWEHEAYNIGGLLIPMSELPARINEIPRDKDVVLYCEKGIRSVIAIQRLEGIGFTQLINLSGGMKAWREANWG
jgi:adenylyltransferase/sulfurtransferase